MNDLDLMKEFRADAAPAEPATLNRARAGMFRPAARQRQWAWRLVPAGALAAVAAAVAVVGVNSDEAATPERSTEAAQVLRLAAAEARREPVLPARPDQFVYVESRVAWAGGGPQGYQPPVEQIRHIWLSVDGSQTGLLREKPAKPGTEPSGPDLANVPLTGGEGIPAYLRDLPTEEKAMRAYLYKDADDHKPAGPSPDTRAFTKVGDTLREQYVPPASVAAMFDAAATIGGTSVVKQVDLAGRHGIAVSRTDQGTRHDLIFDSSTYKFLGERD
ncbi:MAG TPA: CU044_5270 family protein, partial [Actinoplanes sp.]